MIMAKDFYILKLKLNKINKRTYKLVAIKLTKV